MTPRPVQRQTVARQAGWLHRIRRLWRDERGAYSLEFGLCAIPFFGLICAFCEASYVNYESDSLQAVVSAAGRAVLTGNAQITAPTAATFLTTYNCANSNFPKAAPCDSNHVIIDIRPAASFTTADTNNDFYKTTPQYNLGGPSTIVVLRVAYAIPSILPLSIYGSIGTVNDVPNVSGNVHLLLAADAFMTEP